MKQSSSNPHDPLTPRPHAGTPKGRKPCFTVVPLGSTPSSTDSEYSLARKELSGRFVALVTVALFAVGIVLALAGGAAGRLGDSRPANIDSNRPVDSTGLSPTGLPPAVFQPGQGSVAPANNGEAGYQPDREVIRPDVRDSEEGEPSDDDDRSDMMISAGRQLCCLQGNISISDRVRDEG